MKFPDVLKKIKLDTIKGKMRLIPPISKSPQITRSQNLKHQGKGLDIDA